MRPIFALSVFLALPALAEPIPIFSQGLDLTLPPGFVQAFEHRQPPSFLREYLPPGETLEAWSQMITLTGAEGAAPQGPEAFAQQMAEGFHDVCPQSLTSLRLDDPAIAGAGAVFSAFLACGDNGEGSSESVVFLVVTGQSDTFTLQWAEIGPRSDAPPPFEPKRWYPRLSALASARLCCGP